MPGLSTATNESCLLCPDKLTMVQPRQLFISHTCTSNSNPSCLLQHLSTAVDMPTLMLNSRGASNIKNKSLTIGPQS